MIHPLNGIAHQSVIHSLAGGDGRDHHLAWQAREGAVPSLVSSIRHVLGYEFEIMQIERQTTSGQVEAIFSDEMKRLVERRERLRRIDDDEWESIVRRLPVGLRERTAYDPGMRIFVEAVLWLADTGLVWRMLPQEYGTWRGCYMRFIRWAEKGIWRRVAPPLSDVGLRKALVALADNHVRRKRRLRMIANEEIE